MKTKPKTAKSAKAKNRAVKVKDLRAKKEVKAGFNPQPDPPGRRAFG